jgi:branched-chain amino acid aminotransferase
MSFVLFNEQLTPSNQPCFTADDRSLLGHGTFTTLRIKNQQVLWLAEHHARLHHGAKALGIPFERTQAQLQKDIDTLVAANMRQNQTVGCRVTLTLQSAKRGLIPQPPSKTNYLIALFECPSPQATYALNYSTIVKNARSPLSQLKTLQYLEPMLAKQQALDAGVNDALLLNPDGNLAEATTSNIFILRNKILYTPQISDGAFPGIAREKILFLAKQFNFVTVVDTINKELLASADTAFLSNCLWPIQAITQIEAGQFDAKAPLLKQLQLALLEN